MKFNPEIHHRKSIRLREYDYSQDGLYFVTICLKNTGISIVEIENGNYNKNRIGIVIDKNWYELMKKYSNIEMDEFILMPNHLHGIIVIKKRLGKEELDNRGLDNRGLDNRGLDNRGLDNRGLDNRGLINQTPTDEDRWILMKNNRLVLGKIIRWFKAKSAKEIHEKGHLEFQWQRNYYEKIIRNERQLNAIREYIRNNPINWAQDPDNPINFNNKDLQKDL